MLLYKLISMLNTTVITHKLIFPRVKKIVTTSFVAAGDLRPIHVLLDSISDSDTESVDTAPSVSDSDTESVDTAPSVSDSDTESVDTAPSISDSDTESVDTAPSISDSDTESIDTAPSISDSDTESVDTTPDNDDSTTTVINDNLSDGDRHQGNRNNNIVKKTVIPVCKAFFLGTIGMTEWSVKNWPKQAAPTSTTPPVQQIKTPKRSHKDEKASASAKQFLKSLPKLPSHYCQADTNKQYLERTCI